MATGDFRIFRSPKWIIIDHQLDDLVIDFAWSKQVKKQNKNRKFFKQC